MPGAGRRRPSRARSGHGGGTQAESEAIREPIGFEEFELGSELRSAGALVEIASKPFAMLCYLARHRDRVVPKRELLERLWPDVSVSDAALSSALKDLRRALGDDGSRQAIIRTVRGRGLRFSASVRTGARAPRSRELPFVGRGRELRQLIRCVEEAVRGRPRVAIVVGDPGAGKTRLVEELVRHPSSAEFAIAFGYCEDGSSTPYLPFVQSLRALRLEGGFEAPRGKLDAGATLQRLLRPELPQSRRLTMSQRDDGARERADLFRSMWRTIVHAAQRKPTLLAIQDLHHADAASLDLFASLAADISDARSSDGAAVVLVATTQPPRPGSRLAVSLRRILAQSGCSSITLSGLGVRATADLLAALGIARSAPSLPRVVRKVTGGNPLFIRDLVREAGGPEALADCAPGDLRAAIASRVARLDFESLEVLRVAAFIGERFGLSELSAAVRRTVEDLTTRLGEAIRSGILAGDERGFRFEHTLVREVLRDATPPERRREIHRDLAAVLEDHYASDPNEHAMEIASHLIGAGDLTEPDRLILYATRAGDQAFAVCAWQDALFYYDAALATPARFAHAERAELQLRMGLAAEHDAQPERAVDCYERAASDFHEVGEEVGAAWAAMYSARTHMRISLGGFGAESDLQPLEELIRKLGESEAALRGRLLVTIAEGAWVGGRPARTEEVAQQALALGQGLDDDALCHDACMALALARFSHLQLLDALGGWLDADAYARRSRDLWLETRAGPRIALALTCLGRFSDARERVRDAQILSRRAHNSAALGHGLAAEAELELAAGRLSAADEAAGTALAHAERSQHAWPGSRALIVRASVAAQRGAWQQAELAISSLLESDQSPRPEDPIAQFLASTYRLLVRSYQSPADVPRGELAELVGQAKRVAMSGYLLSPICALVEVACDAGAHEERRALQGALEVAYERGFVLSGAWASLLPRLLGRCALQDGRVEAAEATLDRAIDAATACGARGELARAYLERARLGARTDDGPRGSGNALTDASAAAELAAELGMQPLERQARRFLRERSKRGRRNP